MAEVLIEPGFPQSPALGVWIVSSQATESLGMVRRGYEDDGDGRKPRAKVHRMVRTLKRGGKEDGFCPWTLGEQPKFSSVVELLGESLPGWM